MFQFMRRRNEPVVVRDSSAQNEQFFDADIALPEVVERTDDLVWALWDEATKRQEYLMQARGGESQTPEA